MSPITLAMILAFAMVAFIIVIRLVQGVLDNRQKQQLRQEAADAAERRRQAAAASDAQNLDIAASVFDPIGLFH